MIVDGLAIREGNKGYGGDNKSGGGGKNSGRGGGGNHNTSGKNDNRKITPTSAKKSGYTQQAWSTISCVPIRRGNGSTKSGN